MNIEVRQSLMRNRELGVHALVIEVVLNDKIVLEKLYNHTYLETSECWYLIHKWTEKLRDDKINTILNDYKDPLDELE